MSMDDTKTARRVKAYATKLTVDWLDHSDPGEGTDEQIADILDHCVRPAPRELYPAIRGEAHALHVHGVRPSWMYA